jgi:hypothetical protein
MKLTATLKCDRSGRTFDKEIDTTEVAAYEGRQKVREEGLRKVEEFFAAFPKEELPDLVCVYQGKLQAFINVIPDYNDKAISRLLEQLFHVSDPSARAKKAKATRSSKNGGEKKEKADKKAGKSGVQDKAAAT